MTTTTAATHDERGHQQPVLVVHRPSAYHHTDTADLFKIEHVLKSRLK